MLFLTRQGRFTCALFLLFIATLAYGQSQKTITSSDVKLSLYNVSHQKYAATSGKGSNGVEEAWVDGKTQTGPLIVLDPIVIGNPEDHPGKTVIQKLGNDQLMLRVSGSVFDILADGIANDMGNVRSVKLHAKSSLESVGSYMAVQTIPLADQRTVAPNPYQESFDEDSEYFQPLRPFPYAGRFESDPVLIYDLYDIEIALWASSVLGHLGHASIEVIIENETHADFDIQATIAEPYPGEFYYEPMLLHITDPSISDQNVADQKALVNGVEVGLRILDGQLQLDRPLFASYKKPSQDLPNLVQIPGDPGAILVEYKGEKLKVVWGYTSSR